MAAKDELQRLGVRLVELEDRMQLLEGSSESSPELILKNHTETNIRDLARFIQTEGHIGYSHFPSGRAWGCVVSFTMGVKEPVEYTAKLISIKVSPMKRDGEVWNWEVTHRKALQLIQLIKPYLMADKLEEAEYVLRVGRASIPHIEWRPMYKGLVERAFRPILLYPQYIDYPIKYSKVVKRGEKLPKPTRYIFPLKYTPQHKPIIWREDLTLI